MRKCSDCSRPMMQGYVIDDGLEYYCSDACLSNHINEKDYEQLYQTDAAYWTEWETMSCDNCGKEESEDGYLTADENFVIDAFYCSTDCMGEREMKGVKGDASKYLYLKHIKLKDI